MIGATASRASGRSRSAALLYLCCVLALAVGGGLLGVRLLQTGAAGSHVHGTPTGPTGLGSPVRTSFGLLQVESVEQIRGLTPKALAGVTHGIHSLVQADQMQVQLLLALSNAHSQSIAYDPADFRLRLVPGGKTKPATKTKSKSYASVTTSVRAGKLPARSELETTVGFVIPRFNPKGTRLSLEFRERGRSPLTLDLGRVRPGGSLATVQAALSFAHHH